MVKVQDEGDVNSWPECLHGDWKFLMHSSGIIHHKGIADPEKWAKILERLANMNNRPTTGWYAVIGFSINDDSQLFPQSVVHNNKDLNSRKETGRDNLKRNET